MTNQRRTKWIALFRDNVIPKLSLGLGTRRNSVASTFHRLGDFTENALGHFQALGRELEDIVFRLKITGERDEDRHDEPAKETRQDEEAKVFDLRGGPAPDRFFRHGSSFIRAGTEHKC